MFACKQPCCGNSDPVSDVVKVDASKLAGKENAKPVQLQKKEADEKKLAQQKEEERRQVEEENRRRRQEEEARRRREEQEAKDRAAKEAAEREAAEAATAQRRLQEERELQELQEEQRRLQEERRFQAEQEIMEAEERARQEREAAERAAQKEAEKKEEERLAQEKVNAWCKTSGFVNMSTSKKSFMSGTRFPIHEAVTKNDAEIVGLMLQLGVDKSVKNSKGKTAMDIADKLNKNGSMDAIISKLNGNFP